MTATKKTEVALSEENKSLSMVPDFMDEGDFGGGFEGADNSAYAIPFLQILQKMSPVVDKDDAKYIEGAQAGMLFNSVTQQLFDGKEGTTIIPCSYKRSFIQWGGREGAEKGFKGEFTPEQIEEMTAKGEIVASEGKLFKPEKDGSFHEKKSDRYEDTRLHFVLVDDGSGNFTQAMLSLSASQIKASKMLMTALQQKKIDTPRGRATPPTFANLVKVTTVGMKNDQGTWSGLRMDLDGLVTDKLLYEDAKAFYKAVVSGAVNVDHSKSEQSEQAASDKPVDAQDF